MKVINYQYDNNKINFLLPDGKIIERSIKELGYPYFFCVPKKDLTFRKDELKKIVKVEKGMIKYLHPQGIKEIEGYKIYVYQPMDVPIIRKKCETTFESNIPYIRRLAYDKVIEWYDQIPNYADIDIEERNGKIEIIGYMDNVTNKYEPLYTIEDFLKKLKERKIVEIYAWNGNSYDFLKLMEQVKKYSPENYKFFDIILKLDAMILYSIYTQQPPRTLNQAGLISKSGQKVELNKPFNQLTKEELEYYNKGDVELQRNILNKFGIRELSHLYSHMLMLHPDEVYSHSDKFFMFRPSATRSFDSLIIKYYPHIHLLDKKEVKENYSVVGGKVLSPKSGLYENVCGLDFTSLYPTWIMHKDYNNYVYKVIQEIERKIFNERMHYKKLYKETREQKYNTTQQALKILINSLYGIFQNKYFRYADSDVANFITAGGRTMITLLVEYLIKNGYKPVYGDTDSVFISNVSQEEANKLVEKINQEFYPFEVKIDKYFTKALFL